MGALGRQFVGKDTTTSPYTTTSATDISCMFRYKAVGSLVALGGIYSASSKINSDAHKPARMITEDDVKSILIQKHGENQSVYYDFSELPSLGEDGNCQGQVGAYQCWGIFDGHSGWSASTHVSTHIIEYLKTAYTKHTTSLWGMLGDKSKDLSSEEMDSVISEAFVALDNDMIQAPLKAVKNKDAKTAASVLPVALNGSCAMMAFYHPVYNRLKVALVGDSRTVLGVQSSDGVWHAKNLTYDQTGGTPSEIARIRAEHPNDPPEIVSRGRVLGYEPSRTFGDAVTKWTKQQQAALKQVFWSNSTPRLLFTPPYLTARPVISTVELDPTKPTFMVMGCDGLYEWLSNEQVVSLVGQWLDSHPVIKSKAYGGINDLSDDDSGKAWMRPKLLGWGPLKPSMQDENAATHLIRNALGGAEFTKVSLLMSIPSPLSRRHRDDISCTVVFFNPQIKSKL